MFRPLYNSRLPVILFIVFLSIISTIVFTRHFHIAASPFTTLHSSGRVVFTAVNENFTRPLREPRVAKASMLYGPPNFLYEAAIESHARHNKLHGYEMYVSRTAITKGYWNKLLWLQHLMVTELQKPEGERLHWIMYVDPSIVLLNDRISLRTFLPPADPVFDSLALIATKPDGMTLSAASFFLRISPTSLKILTAAMVAPKHVQSTDSSTDLTSKTLQVILEEEYKDAAIYQPVHWYNNAVSKKPSIHSDSLLVRFPHDLQGHRWKYMDNLLSVLSWNPQSFSKKIEDTMYATEPQEFWMKVAEAREILEKAEEHLKSIPVIDDEEHKKSDSVEYLQTSTRDLRLALESAAWDTDALERSLATVKGAMGLE
ncbi:glycosyltransferase family 34 protein [Pleomassaria siparia CBS 279.74]|uniref:Glycosyltransferase family 34 protein n=1 Tax=Pleomassaria siparia CBS 279.74 TaxID=1314801 RepID=A0A6G1KTA5_9PLEO|nr:glycosyltransferase family 34 protein [Pleomassaria siparia CBS 279.74]